MTVYYILLALILLPAYPLCIKNPSTKKRLVYVCLSGIMMLLMCSFRYAIGSDYFHYRTIFYDSIDASQTFTELSAVGMEPGYIALMKLVELVGGDYTLLNFITAALTVIPACFVVYRYSKMPWVSLWLYVTVTFFYNTMNFTRQSIAAAAIFLAYPFIRDKKHIRVLICVLIGALFHKSVLIMIPVYLFSLIKPSAKSLTVIGSCGLAVVLLSDKLLDIGFKLFPSYAKYADSIYITTGLSPVFLIIPLIMAAIVVTAWFMGMKDTAPENGNMVNFMFYSALIWMLITKHFILERFTLPIYIFMLLVIPESLCFFKDKFSQLRGDIGRERKHDKAQLTNSDKTKRELYKGAFPAITCAVIVLTFMYNEYCADENVHNVFPYKSVFNPSPSVTDEMLSKTPRMVYVNSDFTSFLHYASLRDCTVLLCASGDTDINADIPIKLGLKKLGFETDVTSLDGKSYIGVVSRGKPVFELTSDERIEEKLSLFNGKYQFAAVSGGVNGGNTASLVINRLEFFPEGSGLHFAVFDNKLERIVTSQAYAPTGRDYSYVHSNAFNGIAYNSRFGDDFKEEFGLYE